MFLGEPLEPPTRGYGASGQDEALKPVVKASLAKSQDGDARLVARLKAVQAIFGAGLVSEIERLTVGAPTARGVKVTLAGRTRAGWNGETKAIRVDGLIPSKGAARKSAPGTRKGSGTSPP